MRCAPGSTLRAAGSTFRIISYARAARRLSGRLLMTARQQHGRIRPRSPRCAIRRLRAVVICPSNPLLSIEPMLAVAALRDAIAQCAAPVVAVSPIIGGRAIKGPTAKMMAELGLPVTPAAVARRYTGLINGYVLDRVDAGECAAIDVPVAVANTFMQSLADREALARAVLAHADALLKVA